MAVKSSISLTDEQYAFARALVEAGRYASLSAVLQQGVDLLRQRMDAEELEHVALRELLSRRREGEFLSEQRMDARLSRMIAGKRRAHGLPSPTLEFSAKAERDFDLIFDHLLHSYLGFGESLESALDHAGRRVLGIRSAAERILSAPYRGERHDDILPGARHLTIGRAIYWFEVDEARRVVRVLAVFFGGQDHVRHMMIRLLDDRPRERE